MVNKCRFDADGLETDELSPDFEEFEASYFDVEDEFEGDILEDEDSEYCRETQDQEFSIDYEGKELDF
jgi:hypothetical protein